MAYSAWTANTVTTLGTVVRAGSAIVPTGLVFECTTAGTTGSSAPPFGTDVGSTVTDNTVVWTAISSIFEDLNSFAPDKINELFDKESLIEDRLYRDISTIINPNNFMLNVRIKDVNITINP